MTMLPMPDGGNPDMALPGLASLLAAIRGTYPKAQITSGYRGPNNPLTLKNPGSYHAHGSPNDPMAVDVAPIPGVSFQDYVSSIRKQGVPIAEAFDEAKHPFPWTTGPNWHLAQGSPPKGAAPQMPAPQKPYYTPEQTKPGTLASLINQPAPVNMGGPLVAPPPEQPQQMAPHPTTLGDLTGLDMPKMPEKKTLGLSKKQWGAMLAALGDSLNAYAGHPSNVLGGLMQSQEAEQNREFDRERWSQELAMKEAEMRQPPQFAQNAMWLLSQPKPVQDQVLRGMDMTNPIFTATPQGTQVNHRYDGPPPEAIGELRAAVGKGDHAAVDEFEQVFGRGSASTYLAQ